MLGFVSQRLEWRVKQFVDETIEAALDFVAARRVDIFELVEKSPQFDLFNLVSQSLEAPDGGACCAVVQFGHEALCFVI